MRINLASSLTLLCTLAGATASAGASTPALATSVAPEPTKNRLEVDVGMLAGATDIGPVDTGSHGLHANLGYRLHDVSLLGELSYLSVGDGTGTMTRFGLLARYAVLSLGGARSPLASDWWVEAGGGRERVTWDGGGVLSRNDLALGFGMQLAGRLDRNGHRPRHLGPYLGLRAHLARAPEPQPPVMPTCAGPCDRPTGPASNDVSLYFHFGMHFGR